MSRGVGFAPGHEYVIRGIYDDEADEEFKTVKTFDTANECDSWMKRTQTCTNPDYPKCKHIYTTLCDWEQVHSYLLKPLAALRSSGSKEERGGEEILGDNVFRHVKEIRESVNSRLNLPFHAQTSEESTLNSLRYLYYHMKCGIFVCIKDNRVKMFVPFVNSQYVNTWADVIKLEGGSLDGFLALKSKYGKPRDYEGYLPDISRWWANGNIICNVESDDFWGDAYLPQLKHMLQTLCDTRKVPDCEFFINKRDFPHLKANLTEPYDFIYDHDDVPLSREKYATYAPIVSFFVGKSFADVPFVTTDDWETATGKVFPPRAIDIRSAKNRKSNEVAWGDRIPTAFFRGNATGPGTDAKTNQRIKLATLSAEWEKSAAYGDGNALDGIRYLDAGVVGWNLRDRKLQGEPMTFIKPPEVGISAAPKVPMYKQMIYKFHIYADGHCAAMRYASMMPLGAVILKINSYTKADSMWYFPLLRPFDIYAADPDPLGDHIPVKSDLSDLAAVIEWCKKNDGICAKIAENSKSLYERLIAYEGQIDYMQLVLFEIASRFRSRLSPVPLPKVLVPTLTRAPFGTRDWFGIDNREYVDCLIGRSLLPAPKRPEFATTGCECPSCETKRKMMDYAAAAQAAHASHHSSNVGKGLGAMMTSMQGTKVIEGASAADMALSVANKAKALALLAQRKVGAGAAGPGDKRPRPT